MLSDYVSLNGRSAAPGVVGQQMAGAAKDERESLGSTNAKLYRRLSRHHSRAQAEGVTGYR